LACSWAWLKRGGVELRYLYFYYFVLIQSNQTRQWAGRHQGCRFFPCFSNPRPDSYRELRNSSPVMVWLFDGFVTGIM